MKLPPMRPLLAAAMTAGILLAAGSCDLGSAIKTSGPTEVEGLTGILVTPTGSPVSGAWVKVYPAPATATAKAASANEGADIALDSTLTESNGSFLLKGLANGTYNLAARAQRNDTTLALFLKDVIVVGRTNLGVDTLHVAGDLIVRVNAGGEGLVGAMCFISASPWSSVSDAMGDCKLAGIPPGEFQVSISYSGNVVVDAGNIVVTPGASNQDSVTVPLPSAGSVPALISPAANATGVMAPSATFSWMGVEDALHYRLQVAKDSLFAMKVVDDTVPASDVAGPMSRAGGGLTLGTSYLWRVIAVKVSGNAASEVLRFATAAPETTTASLVAPTLFAPADSAQNTPVNPTLLWSKVSGATGYHFQVAVNHLFNFNAVLRTDSMVTDTSRAISGLSAGTQYYWRVRARSGNQFGAWSTARLFVTTGSEQAILVAPVNGAAGVSTSPLLVWTAVPGVAHYQVQVATDSTFLTGLRINDSAVAEAAYRKASLDEGATCFWRVRAKVGGAWGPWSAVWRFGTTASKPAPLLAAPILLSPVDSATGVSLTPVFSWYRSSEAASYTLQVAADSTFASSSLRVNVDIPSPITADAMPMQLASGPFSPGTTLYWRVVAVAGDLVSVSVTRRFTTGP